MGNRGRKLNYKFDVWERFAPREHHVWRGLCGLPVATPEQTRTVKLILTKLVEQHVQKNGAKGLKRKLALHRFRCALESDGSVIELVRAAVQIGIPYDEMSAIVTLLN